MEAGRIMRDMVQEPTACPVGRQVPGASNDWHDQKPLVPVRRDCLLQKEWLWLGLCAPNSKAKDWLGGVGLVLC